ncbi:MAG TPA: hypothetical protein VH331_07425 [Allosphingosinicella sp.]|jgi:hypothetical protein|nr:hypothetical protein [Allosphingosinicella sp.]
MIAEAGRRGLLHAGAALLLFLLFLALFWPGIALYDSVYQYEQALTGAYDDWHPPVMARLWSLLAHVWRGTGPMFLLQLGLFWLGIGLLAAACARRDHKWAGWAVLALGASSFLSCWMAAILKDVQMVGALTAAAGFVGWYLLQEQRLPAWAAVIVLLLLLYAVLVRANAVFAVVPLGLALFDWVRLRALWTRAALALAMMILIIFLTPAVNRSLLGADRSGVENSLLAYDIVGTAIRARAGDVAGLPPSTWSRMAAKGCYSEAAWGSIDAPRCQPDPRLTAEAWSPPLYRLWLETILRHPLAYAEHRLAHFNSTMRLAVPANLRDAMSPIDPESNNLGLGRKSNDVARAFWSVGAIWTALPVGWPAFWLALALVALWLAARAAASPERDLALAFLLSAVCGGLSYGVVSVASDLRYHLWTILAAGLGIALLAAAGAIRRRHLIAFGIVAGAVTVAGVAGRLLLTPLPPPV